MLIGCFLLTWYKYPKHVKSGLVSLFVDDRVNYAQDFKHPASLDCLRVRNNFPPSDGLQNLNVSKKIKFCTL